MAIRVIDDPFFQRGRKDARRHREKQEEAIKKNLPGIIARESIISREGKKTIKVPIKILEVPDFRPQRPKQSGNGSGSDPGSDKPSNEPGEDYLETEVELEEIIGMMIEDLGLPNLYDKHLKELETILGYKFSGITRSGPMVLLEEQDTAEKGLERFYSYLYALEQKTGRTLIECSTALKQTNGVFNDALATLLDPNWKTKESAIEPFPIFETEDLRFHKLKPNVVYHSNAVVVAMMDVSGSMFDYKKYLAKSSIFWLVECLRLIYERVEIRFIIHHTQAKIVSEEDFFRTGESGGTLCYTAFDVANNLIDSEYPSSQWNIYCLLYSDGDDFEPKKTVNSIHQTLARGVNMIGYNEIHVDYDGSPAKRDSLLLPELHKGFNLRKITQGSLTTYVSDSSLVPVIATVIMGKDHIWPTLKELLKGERWS